VRCIVAAHLYTYTHTHIIYTSYTWIYIL
jgi:hypothetical protein